MEEVARLADKFWFYAKDKCDNSGDSKAQQLIGAVRQLHNDAKANRDDDYLYERVRQIETMVNGLRNSPDVYDNADVDEMYDRCQDLKQKLRS